MGTRVMGTGVERASCVFCGAATDDLEVVAPEGSAQGICSACIVSSLETLASEHGREVQRRLVDALVESLEPSRVRDELSRLVPATAEAATHGDHVSTDPQLACVLCRGWRKGLSGVEGVSGRGCGHCVVDAATVLNLDSFGKVGVIMRTFAGSLVANRETEPFLRAMLEFAGTAEDRRDVERHAAVVQHTAIAREALEGIPLDERTDEDILRLAVHLNALGEPASAMRVHRELEPRAAVQRERPFGRAVYLLNRSTFALDAGVTTNADLARCEADLREARALFDQVGDKDGPNWRAAIHSLHAKIYLQQRRLEDASRELAAAVENAPHNALRWELEGVVRQQRGDREGAREAWRRGSEIAHPDSRVARSMADRLEQSSALRGV